MSKFPLDSNISKCLWNIMIWPIAIDNDHFTVYLTFFGTDPCPFGTWFT